MSYCEFCGAKLEEGQMCNCPIAGQYRARAAAPMPQPDHPPLPAEEGLRQQEWAPPQPAAGQYPPPQTGERLQRQEGTPPQSGAGQYPPPGGQPSAPGYPPPPTQGAYPPPPYYGAPPQGNPSYGAQPDHYGAPQGAYPNQYANQAHQALNAVHNTLGSFIKDPYGMAAMGESLPVSVSMVLLGVQTVAFFLMVAGSLTRVAFFEIGAWLWVKALFLGVVGIALLYGCLFIAGKIARIPLRPKALLSAQALSSLPLSVMYIISVVLLLFFGGSSYNFFHTLARSLGLISSVLLMEASLRATAPVGVGNSSRMVALTCAYAVTGGVFTIFSTKMVYMAFPFLF